MRDRMSIAIHARSAGDALTREIDAFSLARSRAATVRVCRCGYRVVCHWSEGATGRTKTTENDHGLALSRYRVPPMRSPAFGRPVAT